MGTLYVRNSEQKVLFEEELVGQISDGEWENARPYDHWVPWAECTVRVAGHGESVGRDFYAPRSYQFDRRSLFDVVGERMVRTVRLARVFDLELFAPDGERVRARDLEWLSSCPYPSLSRGQRELVEQLGGIRRILEVASDTSLYTTKQCRADLRDLTAICKTEIPRRTWAERMDMMVRSPMP